MEVVLRCENYVQVDVLTVVDFIALQATVEKTGQIDERTPKNTEIHQRLVSYIYFIEK